MPFGISAASGKPVKAYIWNEDKSAKAVDCLFNPTEYNFSKSNTWNQDPASGNDVPISHFQGGGSTTLTVSLLFDTMSLARGDAEPSDVRDYTEKVFSLMKVDSSLKDSKTNKSRPPIVSFRWGRTWSFKSVITSISQKFSLFTSDGKPVRATLNVTFQQVEGEGIYPAQNPTSGGQVEKVHLVGAGETIDTIAFKQYGDSRKWRLIADFNHLDNPLKLRPGQKLGVPAEGAARR